VEGGLPPRNTNIDDIFKGKLMTFEDIDKLNIQQFKKGGGREQGFKPSDVID